MNNNNMAICKKIIPLLSVLSVSRSPHMPTEGSSIDFVGIKMASVETYETTENTQGQTGDQMPSTPRDTETRELIEARKKEIRSFCNEEHDKRRAIAIDEDRRFNHILVKAFHSKKKIEEWAEARVQARLEMEQTAERVLREEFAKFAPGFQILPAYIALKQSLALSIDNQYRFIRGKLGQLPLVLYSSESEHNARKMNNLISVLYNRILEMISNEEGAEFFTDFSQAQNYLEKLIQYVKKIDTTELAGSRLGNIILRALDHANPATLRDSELQKIISQLKNPTPKLVEETDKYLNELGEIITKTLSFYKAARRLQFLYTPGGYSVSSNSSN